MIFDYSKWSTDVKKISNPSYFANKELVTDAVYVYQSEHQILHFLIQGLENFSDSKTLLITFNAALDSRNSKRPPFFSGSTLAKNLNIPLLAFSDPTVDYNDSIGLAWYLGNSKYLNAIKDIALMIDAIAERLSSHVILIGGSGGGFAAMNILKNIKWPATAIVWNPQTSISEYSHDAVKNYILNAFPDVSINTSHLTEKKEISQYYYNLMDNLDIDHHLLNYRISNSCSLIYLQNFSDWHYKNHLLPFLQQFECENINSNMYLSIENNILFYKGNWGVGHVSPPIKMLTELIECVRLKQDLKKISRINLAKYDKLKVKNEINTSNVAIESVIAGDQLNINVLLSKTDLTNLKFAFYLFSEKIKVDQKWYTDKTSITFKLLESYERLTVKVFISDSFGKIFSKSFPILHT